METALLLGILQLGAFAAIYVLFVQNGRALLRIESLEKSLRDHGVLAASSPSELTGLPSGSVLTDFALSALDGRIVSLSQFRGQPVALIFFNPGCMFCLDFLEDLASQGIAEASHGRAAVIICQGDVSETRRLLEQFPVPYPVLIETDRELSSLYQVRCTPAGYLVDEDGKTASDLLAGGASLLAALKLPVRSTQRAGGPRVTKSLAQSRLVRDGLKKGATAPPFTLTAVDGTDVSLSDFERRRLLLVFSDPQCEPCQELAPKLEQIHRTIGDLAVLMISRGDVEANKQKAAEHRLTFPVVLQRHWEISRAYGMFATPVGYLIDKRGILASGAAVGGEAILRLAAQCSVPVDGRLVEVES